MTSTWQNVAGLAFTPLLLWLIAIGSGLLIERLLQVRLPSALLLTSGFCASVILALAGYDAGVGNALAVPMVLVPAAAGYLVSGREVPARLKLGWPLVGAAVLTYVLFDLSVLASGHWTWTGYNIDNDSAYEMVLIAHLQAHGTAITKGPTTTASVVVSNYLGTGYPLGGQSLLAVLSGVLGVPAAVVWQGFISATAAVGSVAAATVSGRNFKPWFAAAAGFTVMAGALFYQYALQGQIKEVTVVVTILCALAAGRHAILEMRGHRALAFTAIPLAAILAAYNAAGLPYLGALLAAGLVAMLVMHRRLPRPSWIGPGLVGGGVLIVLAIPALVTIATFFNAANAAYNKANPGAPVLGPLLRPLPVSEISGVWLYGDYRLPVPSGVRGEVTVIITVLIFVLLVPALWRMWKAREPGPAIGLVAMLIVLLVVYPRVSPYARGKLLMIASPFVVLACLQALGGFRARAVNALAAVVGLAIAGAILTSDAMAYHLWPMAPVDRLLALSQIGHRLGPQGPVLDSEFEQFAKYFSQPAQLIDGPDAPTPEQLTLLSPTAEYDHSFDLNQEALPFVESFPYVLTRQSPVTSPPPANFQLLFGNPYYELWQRRPGQRVYAHLPVGSVGVQPNLRAPCRQVGTLIKGARRHASLVAEALPPAYGYPLTAATSLSSGWTPSGAGVPGGVKTLTPGRATKSLRIPASGLYRIWLQGNFPRTISVSLDGRTVGSVTGNNTPQGWLSAGVVRVGSGIHVLGVSRPGGGLGPGNGNTQGELDVVSLASLDQPSQRVTVPISKWRSLCGRPVNWIEVVGPA